MMRNAYTDSPELHANLILGSLQLLVWLFFHPSAWRNHVKHIDPMLPPNFCLLELNRDQWRNPILHRLLIIGFIIWPLMGGLLSVLILWSLDKSGDNIIISLAFGWTAGTIANLVVSAILNVRILASTIISNLLISLATSVSMDPNEHITHSLIWSIALGLLSGTVANIISNSTNQKLLYSPTRRIWSIISVIATGTVIYSLILGMIIELESRSTFNLAFGGLPHLITNTLNIIILSIAFGVLSGISLGLASGLRSDRWHVGIILGLVGGLFSGVALGVSSISMIPVDGVSALAGGIAGGIWFGAIQAQAYGLGDYFVGSRTGALAGALGSGGTHIVFLFFLIDRQATWFTLATGLICILLGLTLIWWLPILAYSFQITWNRFLYRSDGRRATDRPSRLRWNSAFWDEHQFLPLYGLDRHLILIAENHPIEGQAAIAYLATGRQRWAAQAAQIELTAYSLESCQDVVAISQTHHSLPTGELIGPASELLQTFSRYSQDIKAALEKATPLLKRQSLNEVERRLSGLRRELTLSSEPYAARFDPVAVRWHQVVANYVHELIKEVEEKQEIENPYIWGLPVTYYQESFIKRLDIAARIEQLLLNRRHPPLLLYGQKRMGKTSLLQSLGQLLPQTIIPIFIDGQAAKAASDYNDFLSNLATQITWSAEETRNLTLPPLNQAALATSPSTCFIEWLHAVGQILRNRDQSTVLLMFDEFGMLDEVQNFEAKDFLNLIRHLIQHHPHFKVLLADSRALEEFRQWAGYLINTQVIKISYLEQEEACQLIRNPAQNFQLVYEPEAIQRIVDLTRCHPALVQLLCYEIVEWKNKQNEPIMRRLVYLTDVEAAAPLALERGTLVFADIEGNQIDATGRSLLTFLAAQGEGGLVCREVLADQVKADNLSQTLNLLARRDLIEAVEGGYRFQVELIRRWFAQREGEG